MASGIRTIVVGEVGIERLAEGEGCGVVVDGVVY